MRSRNRAVAALSAVLLVAVGNVAAHADNAVADGDGLIPVAQSNMAFGAVDCNTAVSRDALVAVTRQGGINQNVFANGASVTVTVTSVDNAAVQVADPVTTITLPGNWTTIGNNALSAAVSSAVSVTPTSEGAGSATVEYAAVGAGAQGGTVSREALMQVSWTAGACSVNQAPSAPGAPMASSPVNQGGFTLLWTGAEDADGDAFTYTLEGKDADDTAEGVVASGLGSPGYTFAAGAPAEGTWTYRVKAVESGTTPALAGTWSATSAPVVVDRTAPNAPLAAADRAPEHTSGSVQWWQGSVDVSFTGNGDPALGDGSPGSGVASVTGTQTFSASGPGTASGTATDTAGNSSAPTLLPVNVDATAPVVTVGAAQEVLKGSSASVTWNAGDAHSGLDPASAATGSVVLDTSTVGTHTVTIPAGTALDNVGNQSSEVTYSYSVVYDFTGFFQPVDMGRMNVAKAGSAVPIKFSLGGNHGLDVLAAGSPTFVLAGAAVNGDEIETTVTAGSSSLSYDATSGQYVYVWKTDKAWAGRSGTLKVTLADGKTYTASFSFKK